MPELAQKINMFFALAPAVTVKYAKSPIIKMSCLLDKQCTMIQVGDDSMLLSPKHTGARKGFNTQMQSLA